MPVGGEFLEVLEPFRDDASGARYLARRGGDAGYMVILQDDDALAHRARLEAMGVRVIAKSDGRYRYTHFHPADCAGVLLSIDFVEGDEAWREPTSDWPPAGPDWRDFQSDTSLGIAAVTIQARDPRAAGERWSVLLDRRATRVGRAIEIDLERGADPLRAAGRRGRHRRRRPGHPRPRPRRHPGQGARARDSGRPPGGDHRRRRHLAGGRLTRLQQPINITRHPPLEPRKRRNAGDPYVDGPCLQV